MLSARQPRPAYWVGLWPEAHSGLVAYRSMEQVAETEVEMAPGRSPCEAVAIGAQQYVGVLLSMSRYSLD
jgi:hypothetical protein